MWIFENQKVIFQLESVKAGFQPLPGFEVKIRERLMFEPRRGELKFFPFLQLAQKLRLGWTSREGGEVSPSLILG